MQVQDIKTKIGLEVLNAYVASMNACITLADLQVSSRKMIKNVVELVFPKHKVELLNQEMPQDILNNAEEHKEQNLTSEKKLILWLRQINAAIQDKVKQSNTDLQLLSEQKILASQLLNNLKAFADIQPVKPVLDSIDKKIAQIQQKNLIVHQTEVNLIQSIGNQFRVAIEQVKDEEHAGKNFRHKLTAPYKPIVANQDTQFPAQNLLSYYNYLIAVGSDGGYQFNFILSNGDSTKSDATANFVEKQIQPNGQAIKKIVLWYGDDQFLYGFQLFDGNGTVLYEQGCNGFKSQSYKPSETILKGNERIIGLKGRKYSHAGFYDFQFIIGYME